MKLFTKMINLYSPTSGQLKVIDEAKDEVFASKAMGDGFLIEPNNGQIYSPVEGKVTSIFPTKHAIGIESKGLEFLLHMGINTVELKGEGFEIRISEGESVNQHTLLANVDLDLVKSHDLQTDIMLVCTNLNRKKMAIDNSEYVTTSQKIGFIN